MTKDITWTEKVRVSALRAACASEFETESEFIAIHSHPDGQTEFGEACPGEECQREEAKWFPEKDERRTERILARAEVFERWLARGGWETIGQVTNKTQDCRPVPDNPQP